MRTPIITCSILALSACWNAKPGQDAGAGGEAGAGGGCATCGEVAFQGSAAAICQSSSSLLTNLQGCACDPGPCSAECSGSLCAGGTADATCKGCLQAKCATNFAVCSNDQATH